LEDARKGWVFPNESSLRFVLVFASSLRDIQEKLFTENCSSLEGTTRNTTNKNIYILPGSKVSQVNFDVKHPIIPKIITLLMLVLIAFEKSRKKVFFYSETCWDWMFWSALQKMKLISPPSNEFL
jgi:hypothetical protein